MRRQSNSKTPMIKQEWLEKRLRQALAIDHLVSEEERQKAEQERKEFEAVDRTMFLTEEALYPVFYESVCEKMDAGVSHEGNRAEMMMLAGTQTQVRVPETGGHGGSR